MRRVIYYIAASLGLALAGAKAVGLAIAYAEDPAGLETGFVVKQVAFVLVLAVVAAVLWSRRNTGSDESPPER